MRTARSPFDCKSSPNHSLWLWVPACAGTTVENERRHYAHHAVVPLQIDRNTKRLLSFCTGRAFIG
jgi:hypothetical protein